MKKFLLGLFLSVILISCNSIAANAMGLFYSNATYPVTATGVTNEDLSALKKGEASTINVLLCVEVGDAGIDKAAKDAGITKISHIDINEKSVFIFFRKLTVYVYGE